MLMDYYIGIDPGKNGAMAVLDGKNDRIIEVVDCPVIGRFINSSVIVAFFERYLKTEDGEPKIFVGIEKAQAMPKQGVVSMFNYGVGYGLYLGILCGFRIPYVEIPPAKWKKEFSLMLKDKNESIRVAKQLFPQVSKQLNRKKDHGRAEAILLAAYARRFRN